MAKDRNELDDQMDLLFGDAGNDEPAESEVSDNTSPVSLDAIEDVTELFKKSSRSGDTDSHVPDYTVEFDQKKPADDMKNEASDRAIDLDAFEESYIEEDEAPVKPSEKAPEKPVKKEKAEKRPAPEVQDPDDDFEDEELSDASVPEEADDFDEADEEIAPAPVPKRARKVKEKKASSEDELDEDEEAEETGHGREVARFWIFTAAVAVVTVAAVLLILNYRGLLGSIKKDPTISITGDSEVLTEAPSTESEATETAETAESTAESTEETSSESVEETSSETESETPSETESETETSSEAESESSKEAETPSTDKAAVVNHYPDMFIVTAQTQLNIRKEASQDSDVVAVLLPGSGGHVLDESGEWLHIRSGLYEGYVKSEFVATGDEAKSIAPEKAVLRVCVTEDSINIRGDASTDNEPIGTAKKGELFTQIGQDGDFYKVVFRQGVPGYIRNDLGTPGYYLEEAVEKPAE